MGKDQTQVFRYIEQGISSHTRFIADLRKYCDTALLSHASEDCRAQVGNGITFTLQIVFHTWAFFRYNTSLVPVTMDLCDTALRQLEYES